jgi:hypothetical protein
MDRSRQKSLSDVDEHARIATGGAAEAIIKTGKLERRVDRLESRVDDLEDAQRPSRVDADFEERVVRAIESARSKSSAPPDIELQNGKVRARGSAWVVVVVALSVVLFAALWQGPEIIGALK